MKLKYKNKSIDIYECKSFFERLKGFMFSKHIDRALLFDRCNSIHTFFMKSNIDVIMCDKDNNILYYFPNLGKRKIIWPKKKVAKTIEMPVSYFDIKVGDKIILKKESS